MVLTRSRSKSSETDASDTSVKTTPNKNKTQKVPKAEQNGTPSKADKIKAHKEKTPIKEQLGEENSEKVEVSNNAGEDVQVKNNKKKENSKKIVNIKIFL
jgi:hypothetical protein